MLATVDALKEPLTKDFLRLASVQKDNNNNLQSAISSLPSVSLREMASVKLMNRIDSKFIVPASFLPDFIKDLSEEYYIQEIEGVRVAEYKTLYLDTDKLKFYLDHVNGKLNHIKWRIRSYIDSDLSFLEIKKKSNTGRTDKNRIKLDSSMDLENHKILEFIDLNSGHKARNLYPVLQNNFNRITLVNKKKSERLTIDLNICFTNCLNGESKIVSNLAIVELKQDQSIQSVAGKYFATKRIKKAGISKYCLGLVLTSDCIKGNIYKQKIRNINKISSQK